MTWFKVDDSFYDHPKIFDAPDCAVALWTRAGAWSARNLTDGFVPAGLPARLCDDPERAVKELLDRGLWRRARGGYQYHDWADYQPTRDDVLNERKRWAEKKAGQRAAKRASKETPSSDHNVSPGDSPEDSIEDSPGESRDGPPGSLGVPSRPVPDSPKGESRRGTRGARVPDDFQPTDEMITWARENAPTVGRRDHDAFMDHWRAQPGQKGVKLDWPATWRNWMRREHTQRASRPNNGTLREHNGLMLTDRSIERLEGRARYEAMDAAGIGTLAIEGTIP